MVLTRLGRYEVQEEIGRGTMGVVYRGHDPVIDRAVALKTVLVPEALSEAKRQAFLERFAQESRIAGKLLHPNIVVTYDAATDEASGIPFIAMELVHGEALDRLMERLDRLPWQEALTIVVPLARALAYAHEQGVVHRDVKPANVIMTHRGVPKLTDFGIAKLPTGGLTQRGSRLGTPDFMSPEQIRGDAVDGRSDLFCLTEVLYSLLTGRPPFSGGELAEIFHNVLCNEPEPPSERVTDIPPALDAVVSRGLAKSPEDRYPDGEELAIALETMIAEQNGDPAASPTDSSDHLAGTVSLDLGADTAPLHEVSLDLDVEAEDPEPRPTAHDAAPDEPEPPPSEVPPSSVESSPVKPTAPRRRPRLGPLRYLVLLIALVAALYAVMVDGDTARRHGHAALEAVGDGATWAIQQVRGLSSAARQRRAEEKRNAQLRSEASAWLDEGRSLVTRGHWNEARHALGRSLAGFRDAGDGIGEASALRAGARLKADTGHAPQAIADAEAALSIDRVYQYLDGEVETLTLLGTIHRDFGQRGAAAASYDQAQDVAETIEDSRSRDVVLLERGIASVLAGSWDDARRELGSVRDEAAVTAQWELSARATGWLAAVVYATGNEDNALSLWEAARSTCERRGGLDCAADLRLLEGAATLARGELVGASQLLSDAEARYREVDNLTGLAATLELGAEVVRRQGDPVAVERRLEELATIRGRLGIGSSPDRSPTTGNSGSTPASLDSGTPCHRLLDVLRGTPRTARAESRLSIVSTACDTDD